MTGRSSWWLSRRRRRPGTGSRLPQQSSSFTQSSACRSLKLSGNACSAQVLPAFVVDTSSGPSTMTPRLPTARQCVVEGQSIGPTASVPPDGLLDRPGSSAVHRAEDDTVVGLGACLGPRPAAPLGRRRSMQLTWDSFAAALDAGVEAAEAADGEIQRCPASALAAGAVCACWRGAAVVVAVAHPARTVRADRTAAHAYLVTPSRRHTVSPGCASGPAACPTRHHMPNQSASAQWTSPIKDLLIEAVKAEGFGGGGVVAAAFGDVQVAGVFDGRDDGGADGGQVGRPAAGAAGGGVFPKVRSRTWWWASMDHCSRTRRARSPAVASALVRLVTA